MRRAFTLVEMLVVLSIIILVTAIALPAVKYSLENSKVTEASRQVNAMFAKARTKAAATGRPCGVLVEQSQLTLMEVPPGYIGDIQGASVVVRDSAGETWGRIRTPGLTTATAMLGPPWQLSFQPANADGLVNLIADDEFFEIRFDGRSMAWIGQRRGNGFILNGETNPPTNSITYPPTATSEWTDSNGVFHPDPGYSFEITRNPIRTGESLQLPQGTAIDLNYSGISNTGREFAGTTPLVMFAPDGHVITNNVGLLHFLVGRPEKVIAQPFADDSNIVDSDALWVTVSTLTGSVNSTQNSANVDTPRSTAAEQSAFLLESRTLANEQGGVSVNWKYN